MGPFQKLILRTSIKLITLQQVRSLWQGSYFCHRSNSSSSASMCTSSTSTIVAAANIIRSNEPCRCHVGIGDAQNTDVCCCCHPRCNECVSHKSCWVWGLPLFI